MKQIPLSQGKFALVDDEDFEYLNQWKWTAVKHRNTFYAQRKITINGRRMNVHMHRVILNAPSDKQVDHINGNALDNRKFNLRLASPRENKINQCRRASKTSGYVGVRLHSKNRNWIAYISIAPGREKHLGSFEFVEDAIAARKEAEKIYYGEFSRKETT